MKLFKILSKRIFRRKTTQTTIPFLQALSPHLDRNWTVERVQRICAHFSPINRHYFERIFLELPSWVKESGPSYRRAGFLMTAENLANSEPINYELAFSKKGYKYLKAGLCKIPDLNIFLAMKDFITNTAKRTTRWRALTIRKLLKIKTLKGADSSEIRLKSKHYEGAIDIGIWDKNGVLLGWCALDIPLLGTNPKILVIEAVQGTKGAKENQEQFRLRAGENWQNYLLQNLLDIATNVGIGKVLFINPKHQPHVKGSTVAMYFAIIKKSGFKSGKSKKYFEKDL